MLTQEILKKLLHYNSETGIFTWKVGRGNRKKGSVADYLNPRGYIRIKINKKNYSAHRLAFLYMTGEFPINEIDHKNSIKNCNIWSNLREVTRSQNMMNSKKHKNSTSGYKGVHWNKPTKKWVARVGIKNKRIYLGQFNTKEDASEAYVKKAKELHGEYYFEKRKK